MSTNEKLNILQNKVINVQTIMSENIDRALQNIDKIEEIDLNSENLMVSSKECSKHIRKN